VRYTAEDNLGSTRVKTHTLDKEASDKESTQPVLYHSIGPATSLDKGNASHMYIDDPPCHIYQDADTNLQCPSESATNAAVQVRDIYNVIIHNEIMFAFFIPGSSGI
jgi:hypothetical protein